MKTVIRFLCLGAILLTSLPLWAQPVCAGPEVEVLSTECVANTQWVATVNVSQGNSTCDFFNDPVTGDSLPLGIHTIGPFSGQSTSLLFSCNFVDSCWTFVSILAPDDFPCNTTTVCGIEFGFQVDTIVGTCGVNEGGVNFVLTATEDYTITIGDENGTTTTQTNNPQFLGLSNGFYTYEIYCADGTVAFEGEFSVFNNSSFTASISSETDDCSNFTLTAETDLPGTYTYSWNTGETTQSITSATGGFFSVEVTDANGCSSFATISVDGNQAIFINGFPFNEICDFANGGIWGNVFGGSAPYQFDWSDGFAGGLPRQDLSAGTYSLTVTDAGGCSTEETFVIESEDLQIEVWATAFCDGEADLQVWASDSIFDLTYTWTDPAGNVISTDQMATATEVGTYTVVVSGGGDCNATGTVTVEEGQPSNLDAAIQLITLNDTIANGCDQLLALVGGNNPNGNWVFAQWQVPGQNTPVWGTSIVPAQYGPGLYVATEITQGFTCPLVDSFYIQPEDLECGNVSGTVYLNLDADCSLQDTDIPLEYQQLVFDNLTTGDTYYGFANYLGVYNVSLPAGTYSVSLGGTNELLELCNPVGFTLAAGQSLSGEDVPVIGTESCPRVEVNVTFPLLRRCFDSPVYINYENTGTVVAEDVVLTVEIGDFASIVEDWTGIPADAIVTDPVTGITTATFNLGDLAPFESGQRNLLVYTCSSDFPLGAAGCVKATVTPNNPCPPADPAWTGASLRVEGSCEGDTIQFRVANVGASDMSVPLSYIVIEDGVLLTPQPVIEDPLQAFDERLFNFSANGATYHFQVEQEPLHPGLMMPIDFVEACGNGNISYGFALQFPLSDDAYWIDEECNEIIGAYDPNDKRAMPRGYSDNHYIEAGDMIDYTIRFQNTGTDTAFNVVVRDTLSEVFDLSTLEVVSSTHPMTPRVDSTGHALAFFFDNIMLPDSFVNEPASHGAVSFRIRALEDLEPGTDVDNGAAIYFDFNEPIFTNVYELEIADDFVTVGLFDFTPTVTQLKVFPNPTAGPAMIELPQAMRGQQLQLEVFDLLGRQQLDYQYQNGDRPRVDLSQLPAGWYTIRLSDQGQLMGTGRILLQR